MQVVHVKKSDYDVYGGRNKNGGELKHMNNTNVGDKGWLGNRYTMDNHSRLESILLFFNDFTRKVEADQQFKKAIMSLEDKKVGCWCEPKPCHLDVIQWYVENH